jgi:hypothetical protein
MNAPEQNTADTFETEQRALEPHYRSVGWESAGGKRVEVPTTDTDEFYTTIDRDLGLADQEDAQGQDLTQQQRDEGLDRITSWLLAPVFHEATFRSGRRDVPMNRKQSAFAKLILLKAAINPASLGLTKTALEYLAPRADISKQVMGRIANDFAEAFPNFVRRGQMRGDVRDLFRRVQLAARDGRLDQLEDITIPTPSDPPPPPLVVGDHLEFDFAAAAEDGTHHP